MLFLRCAAAWSAILPASWLVGAALPPAEQFLPLETLAFVTVPDATRARAEWSQQPPARFWSDPEMRSFRQHFEQQLDIRLLDPFRELTGIDWHGLIGLAEGQVTLALLPASDSLGTASLLEPLLLLDTGSKANELARQLQEIRRKSAALSSPGTALPNAGADFLTLTLPPARLQSIFDRAFPRPPESVVAARTQPDPARTLHLGQFGSFLIATTTTNGVDEMLARLAGRSPALSNRGLSAALPPTQGDPIAYGAIDVPAALRAFEAGVRSRRPPLRIRPPLARIVRALGLTEVDSASAAVRTSLEGWHLDLQLAVPVNSRRGLLRLFGFQAGDASPPPFVPADVLSFTRVRLPGPATWNRLQEVLGDLDPGLLGLVQLFAGYAGKTEDADFDFEKGVIGLLGDDWVKASFADSSGSNVTEDLYLVGSPRPDELAQGLKLVAAPTFLATFLPPNAPEPVREEREVQGHRWIGVGLPVLPWREAGATGALHFVSRPGYVAFSPSAPLLTGFLSNRSNAPPALASRPDFAAAVSAAGGAQGGYLAYRDERAAYGAVFTRVARSPDLLSERLRWAAYSETTTRVAAALVAWFDLGRLPPFASVAGHFGIWVRSGRVTTNGFSFSAFRPRQNLLEMKPSTGNLPPPP